MIPQLGEISQSVYGAYRMARFDPNGLRWFNLSVDGFWRSFFAAVLVAPFFLVLFALEPAPAEVERSPLGEILRYVLQWIIFPVVMISVSKLLGVGHRYVAYIIALNWSAVIQVAVILPLTLLGAAAGGLGSLLAIAFLALMIYHWFITRVALGTTAFTSVAVVALDFLLSLLINTAVTRLVG